MTKFSILLLLFSLSACDSNDVPVLIAHEGKEEVIKVPLSSYENSVKELLEELEHETFQNENYHLDTITISVSTDVRISAGVFNLSPHKSVDFHFEKEK